MFSFHKPKVYRSKTGCCICKAKSSSSRFTDSKRYEDDFLACFQLAEPRAGEVCNACVLLVKRWKKLPMGHQNNWHHVVDARAGPGVKGLTKFKAARNKRNLRAKEEVVESEHEEEMPNKKWKKKKRPASTESLAVVTEEMGGDGLSDISIPPSPSTSDELCPSSPASGDAMPVSSFLDMSYWKPEKVCCGTVYRGEGDVVFIDNRLMKPCLGRKLHPHPQTMLKPLLTTAVKSKAFSDTSSDSGYDECSNQSCVTPLN